MRVESRGLRWLITLLLLCVIPGIGYYIRWELLQPSRIEAQMRRASCSYAQTVAARAQTEPTKYNDLAAWAHTTCLSVHVR